MIKNILITGGAGYIGSHISEVLIKNKKKIFIIDNLSTGYRSLINKKTKFFKVDILKTKKGEFLPVFVHSHHIHQHEKSEQFGVKSPIYIDHLVCF